MRPAKAQLAITVSETYDVEFSTATPQDLLLDLRLPGQKIHTTQTLAFMRASSGTQYADWVDNGLSADFKNQFVSLRDHLALSAALRVAATQTLGIAE